MTAHLVDANAAQGAAPVAIRQFGNDRTTAYADGTEFVGQLAQFQQLETSLNMGQDLTGIRADLDQMLALTATAGKSA